MPIRSWLWNGACERRGKRKENMGFFNKNKKETRVQTIQGLERLFLQNNSDVLYVVAKKGSNIRKICTLEEYEKGIVEVHNEEGKRVMITLQSVSR